MAHAEPWSVERGREVIAAHQAGEGPLLPILHALQDMHGTTNLKRFAQNHVPAPVLDQFPGDGIGPEIAEAVKEIFSAAGAPIIWDEQHIGKTVDERTNSFISRENLDSVLVRRGQQQHGRDQGCRSCWLVAS